MIKKLISKKANVFGKQVPVFIIALIAMMGLVSAAATYYAVFYMTLNIHQPIGVSGSLTQTVPCYSGETCLGEAIIVSNDGTTEKTVDISNNNWNDNVKISYIGELELTQKDLTTWIPTGDSVTITYTVIGDTFEVSGVPSGYVAVYYPNTVSYNHYDGVIVLAEDVTILPENNDLNGDSSTSNYLTNGFNGNEGQAVGGKIWLVPEDSVTGNVIDWSDASEFYFETALIQFNEDGNIVISPHSSVTFKPQFEVNKFAPDWSGTITTTVK